MKTIQKLSKWGKYSLSVTIPKKIITDMGLDSNSVVEITKKDGGIFIKEVKINE
jgi:antitoxin component of MazEF toxin-antitoxin module